MASGSDSDWSRLRQAFDALVDLPPAERAAALPGLGLPPAMVARLQRLLDADCTADARLDTQSALPFAVPAEAPASADDPLPRQLGRYRLLQRLGAGSMGRVYLARDDGLARDVAVKLLSPLRTRDPQWVARFRTEARAAGSLNHPNVLTIHDVGEVEGEHFLTTEYVAGSSLRERLGAGPLPLAEALAIARQLLAAVGAAHERGIVHRDLKPENVMLRRDGLVKVLDFGLAKLTAPFDLTATTAATHAGMLLGTVQYMAPEQARGLPVDARSDVWSLGAMLYELLAGTAPFTGPSLLDTLVALLERPLPPLRERAPGVPDAVAAVVTRALQREPEARHADAGAMLAALVAATAAAADAAPDDADTVPAVHYARSGDVDIAYQVFGSGPVDLVFVMGWVSHLEYFWREPRFARFLRRLGEFARVILFDKRGTGLSDRVAVDRLPTLEQRVDDVRAVLDRVGSERAVLCGVSEGGPMCCLFAATHPHKTRGLVMIGSYARRLRADDYPWGPTPAEREAFLDTIRREWGGPVGIAERAPSVAADPAFRAWWAAYLRHGASPGAAVALTRMNSEIDIRHVLQAVQVPTLVVHRTGDRCLGIDEGRYLADRIAGATLVELPGTDHLPFVGDQDAVLAAIEHFLGALPDSQPVDRVLTTVLVATEVPALDRAALQAAIEPARGELIASGDGRLVVSFDGPARAIHAARALVRVAPGAVRCGLHTGECERRGRRLSGIAVELAAAVAAAAPRGTVVVSSTVRDLVAGSGLTFAAHGVLPATALGELRLFAVTAA